MLGKFGDAFDNAARIDEEVKLRGREALKEAVKRRIFESEKWAGGHEGKLVKDLVRVIMDEHQHDFLPPLPGKLVGIDDRVAEVKKLVNTDHSKTRIIVIYGIGGIGKTTLATIIYEGLSNKFAYRSFLKDVRETIKSKGMEHVQYLLISDITKNHESRVHDSDKGIEAIRISCENKKVIILLDDVDSQAHLDKLIGGCNFESGSRIIITCRDKALLKSEYERYEVKEMNDEDSLLLLSRYAFEGEQPPTELVNLSSGIVATTGGLPLALVMIGSLLKGKPKNIWEETLEKLKKVPNKDVQKVLRITYDSLEYEEQQMFLDIACFFTGSHKRIAIYLWNDILRCQDSGLDRLNELSYITLDDYDKLRMHDHLRDLGRAIACPANKKPWECSRLWGEEAITVQRSKEENRNIEALPEKRSVHEISALTLATMSERFACPFQGDCSFHGAFDEGIHQWRPLKIRSLGVFQFSEEMKSLREVQINQKMVATSAREGMVEPICLASKDKREGDALWIPPGLCTMSNLIS
ncbi:hypothetical protein NL676_013380 [Syzygium grande]|nr:hypothetical protein NL676_013380 [Syzygium grande]